MKYQELLKTEEAIMHVKECFAGQLCKHLNLVKVSSPLVVLDGTGINDDLNGVERPVRFPVKALGNQKAVIVHSLAKWKRLRLKEFGVAIDHGILTDMRALRPDESYTALHSVYVDQWDWEKRIEKEERTLSCLKRTVNEIYEALKYTEQAVYDGYHAIKPILPEKIHFIHTEALLKRYPTYTVKERESAVAKEFGAVFIIGIGGKLSDGVPHDLRAPDYDDWSSGNEDGYQGLNGDLIVWHPVLKSAFELSSMGIRVNKDSLAYQLELANCKEREKLYFHQLLLSDSLPQSIGGGIGQSRVCMFLLKKAHIGQVQVGLWPEMERKKLAESGIMLL